MRYSTRGLAHAWAHQLSPEGKSPSAESFVDAAFYSYGTVIARILTNRKGERAYLLDTARFSITTTRHQYHAWRAIPHGATVWEIESGRRGQNLMLSPRELLDITVSAAERSAQWSFREAKALEQARSICAFYGLRQKIDEQTVSRLRVAAAREEKRRAKVLAEEQARREKENAKKIAAWLAGTSDSFPYGVSRTCLRLDPLDPATVETSRGVRVPLADAERAFRFAVARRAKGWRRNGETCPIGQFHLDSITADGIIAGCHHIAWTEIERFAALRGWL